MLGIACKQSLPSLNRGVAKPEKAELTGRKWSLGSLRRFHKRVPHTIKVMVIKTKRAVAMYFVFSDFENLKILSYYSLSE